VFKNEYILDLDLKFVTSTATIQFRRGDTAVLKFRLYDNGIVLGANQYDKAEITVSSPSGAEIVDTGKIEVNDGFNSVIFQFAPLHMIEVGIYTLYLTVIKDGDRVSAFPIKVRFYDNITQEDLSLLDIIQDLQKEVERIQTQLANGINMSELGEANGVAQLDNQQKIKEENIPDIINNHLTQPMRSDDGAHGFYITEDGIAFYRDSTGAFLECNFADEPVEL